MAESNISFIEESKLYKPYFLLTALPVTVILGVLFFQAYGDGDRVGMFLSGFFLCFMILLVFVLMRHKLRLEIGREGLTIRYAPYFREKRFSWSQVQEASLVQYDPLRDFNGWGLKKSQRYGQGYLTAGNKGLFIQLRDGGKFLVTVRDTAGAARALQGRDR